MSVSDLIKEFDVLKDVPIDVNAVKAALVARGIRDIIWFWGVDIDAEILRGQLVRWKQKDNVSSATGEYRGSADIYYAKSLSRDWQRVVCCKELLHILDPEAAKASSPEIVTRLTAQISLPPDLRGNGKNDVVTLTDRIAILQSIAVLFPWRAREILKANQSISEPEIAQLLDLPERFVKFVMDDDWEATHELLISYK